jgi:phosphoribosylaminoimidazolecarboxamide formyltransferase/IMP cyclohydrolase
MGVKTALISVSDKTGLEEFATGLNELGIGIISTGGTAKFLASSGIHVGLVEDLTGFPEIMDGRVKTLHPKIHGGILSDRRKEEHQEQINQFDIRVIDIVVVNLYPFAETVSRPGILMDEVIENIDIGGPALIRAAAKNYRNVAVVVDPEDYRSVVEELKTNQNELRLATRQKLAAKAFNYTAFYESLISSFFRKEFGPVFPKHFTFGFRKSFEPRYGENPHQKAAFYKLPEVKEPCISNAVQLHGKRLSFNNVCDSDAAIELIKEFEKPAAVIVKHTNPCGAALCETVSEAFGKALKCDPISAFGGIIALNRECNSETAEQIASFFNEVVIAPSYSKEALDILKEKKNLRILQVKGLESVKPLPGLEFRKVGGGLLIQERDIYKLNKSELKTVTNKKPAKEQIRDMLFGWAVARHVKSNAIVLVKNEATVGIGAGQMSRVDSVKLACQEAGGKAIGSVLVSDAFFPFRDSIDLASKSGVTAVIQPGGSVRDEEVIEAADEHEMVMLFTGHRCFRH